MLILLAGSDADQQPSKLPPISMIILESSNCLLSLDNYRKDSFTFVNFIQNYNPEPAKACLCSFDISSLFTNVPLDETIEICADALYQGHLDCPLHSGS